MEEKTYTKEQFKKFIKKRIDDLCEILKECYALDEKKYLAQISELKIIVLKLSYDRYLEE